MSKLIHEVKAEHLDFLKKRIVLTFNKNIQNTDDCEQLKTAITLKTKEQISKDTIARIFEIIKTKSQPSVFTLNVCAAYIGFSDWQNLIDEYNKINALRYENWLLQALESQPEIDWVHRVNNETLTENLFEFFKKLILVKVNQQDKSFFTDIFEFNILSKENANYRYSYYYLLNFLARLIVQNDYLQKKFLHQFKNQRAKDWQLLVYYYVPFDVSFYDEIRFKYLQIDASQEYVLFYNLIYATQGIKNKNKFDLKKNFEKIKDENIDFSTMNNILLSRYLGVKTHYFFHFEKEKYLTFLQSSLSAFDFLKDDGDRLTSFLFYLDYLYELNEYETICNFSEKIKFDSIVLSHWAYLNMNYLTLLFAFSYLQLKQVDLAKIWFSRLDKNLVIDSEWSFTKQLEVLCEKL